MIDTQTMSSPVIKFSSDTGFKKRSDVAGIGPDVPTCYVAFTY